MAHPAGVGSVDLNVGCRDPVPACQDDAMMRVRLSAKAPHVLSGSKFEAVPLSVTIRPANNFPGSYEYQTDSRQLLHMLRHKTEVSGLALSQFEQDLRISKDVKLPFVLMQEELLEELGYFTD